MIRKLVVVALGLAIAGAADAQSTPQLGALDPKKPVYVTAHVDVTSGFTDRAAAALKAYVETARREPGAIRVEALQEVRTNHFDLIEVWRDLAAYEAHTAAPATIKFHDTIYPWRGSPFEERLANAIAP
jgi:quinol monooxygenase YgiN